MMKVVQQSIIMLAYGAFLRRSLLEEQIGLHPSKESNAWCPKPLTSILVPHLSSSTPGCFRRSSAPNHKPYLLKSLQPVIILHHDNPIRLLLRSHYVSTHVVPKLQVRHSGTTLFEHKILEVAVESPFPLEIIRNQYVERLYRHRRWDVNESRLTHWTVRLALYLIWAFSSHVNLVSQSSREAIWMKC